MRDKEKLQICITALKELVTPKGAYSMDKLEHASNTIKEVSGIATAALTEIGEKPDEA